MERIHAGLGRADHLRQNLLRHPRQSSVGWLVFTKARQDLPVIEPNANQ